MLRVNVGLSRKLSKDYNSTGFSVNLDGEITAPVNDPEAVIEQVRELFDVAEEALDQQIERHNGESAIAGRDQPQDRPQSNGNGNANAGNGTNGHTNGRSESAERTGEEELATNKQVQYLLSISKRRGMTTAQLESRIEEVLGRPCGVYELSKRAAGVVIDALADTRTTNGRTNGRR